MYKTNNQAVINVYMEELEYDVSTFNKAICEQDENKCKCFKIVEEINKKFPKADWNCDEACHEWGKRESELEDKKIKFEPFSDECYACTCPTCGRIICGWCV